MKRRAKIPRGGGGGGGSGAGGGNMNFTSASQDDNPVNIFKKLRSKNEDRLLIAHLNIHFLRNKFEALRPLVQGMVDILVISETKLDESPPVNEFILDGFSSPFRADRDSHGGG